MLRKLSRAHRVCLAVVLGAWALLAILLATPGARAATTFTVNTTSDQIDSDGCVSSGTTCSLRDAVIAADAAGGGTIVLPSGTNTRTIASTGGDDPTTGDLDIDNGASVSITGAGAGQTIIDANQIDRAFAVQEAATLDVDGVTIENGAASENSSDAGDGGAIYSDGTLSVSDSTITASSGERGGAIYTDGDAGSTTITDSTLSEDFSGDDEGEGGAIDLGGGTLAITGSTFASDSSYDDGGAIYADAGAVTISGSTFSGDSAGFGGAILADESPVTIDTSTFSGDTANNDDGNDTGAGGAILQSGDVDAGGVTITSSVFSGDSAGQYGGAISYGSGAKEESDAVPAVKPAAVAEPGGLTISDTEITGSAATYGGGLYINGEGTVEIDGSTFDHNTAAFEEGGGIYVNDVGSATITNTTISENQAGQGAGVYLQDHESPIQFTNDTIADNTTGDDANNDDDSDGGGVYAPSDADSGDSGGFVNTIIADNIGGDCADGPAGDADQGNNLDSDGSCFSAEGGKAVHANLTTAATGPILGPLEDNGAPTIGANPGDGALLTQLPTADSGAIDTGSNTACTGADERGTPRPYNGTCDIGAAEVAPATLSISGAGAGSATVGVPFNDTFTITNAGPSPSGLTVLTFSIPSGESFYGVSPANGTCTSSGSTVTCDLADILSGASTSVTLVVAGNSVGPFTNSVTATNVEGSTATGSVTTNVTAASGGSASTATTNAATNTVTVMTATSTPVKPTAVTGAASKTAVTGSTVSGEVTTGGASTTYFFEYGTTTQYGDATPVRTTTHNTAVSATLKNLRAGTTYHYRLLALSPNGEAVGHDRTFTTAGTRSLGALVLDSHTLPIKHDMVDVTFTCDSDVTCSFKFSLTTTARIDGTDRTGPVLVNNEANTVKTIGAHQRLTVTETVTRPTLALLRADGGTVTGKLTSRPRTGQTGIITYVHITS